MLQTEFVNRWKLTRAVLIAVVSCALSVATAHGTPVVPVPNTMLDYTFSGVASGTIVGASVLSSSTFSNQNFSISFIEDPSTVTGADGYYSLSSISGTFTEGSHSGTVTNAVIEVNGNANTGSGAYETINLFNSTFATDMQVVSDPALLGYALATTLAETGSSTGQTFGNYTGVGY